MPIRRSINTRKRIFYHAKYGSVENPPLINQGSSGRVWPSGSAYLYTDVPRHRGQIVVIGWMCYLEGTRHFGLWIATRIGIMKPFYMSGEVRQPPKGKTFLCSEWAEDGTWKFVDIEHERTPPHRRYEKLMEAYADYHDLIM